MTPYATQAERDRADYLEWTRQALLLGCRSCYAQPGEPCVNKLTGRSLEHYAHVLRLRDAVDPP